MRARCAPANSFDLTEAAGAYGATGLVLLAMVRSGTRVSAYAVRHLICARVDVTAETTPEAAAEVARDATAALASVDERKAALHAGLKEDEEFFATYAVQSYTPKLVSFFAKHGITPNGVTWISIAIGVGAAAVVRGGRPGRATSSARCCSTSASSSTAATGSWPGRPASSAATAVGST